jgi:tetratricopeptide (TPR) repeat protein
MMRRIPGWFSHNANYSIILLVFYFFSLLLTPLGNFSSWIQPSDHRGYYSITRIDPGDDTRIHAYLRSMVIDGDIDFFNEKGCWNRFELTPTGYTFDFMYAIGSALLWLPFFLVGHLIAHLYSWLGYPVTTDGFSFPYVVMTGIGSATYLFVGVILCYDLLNHFFTKTVALVTATTVWLGTHLPFYAFIRSRMAHANEFFTISLLLSLWFYMRKRHEPLFYFFFGVIAGLACIVRMDNLPILSFFMIDFLLLFYRNYRAREREAMKKMVSGIISFSVSFLLIFSLPFICARIIWDNSFALGGISKGGGDVSTPLRFAAFIVERSQVVNIWNFFFSQDKGLFLSSPFWLFALIGMWFFWKRERYWGGILLVGLSFPLIWNIIDTSTGMEYGIRRTTAALPFLSFGFAAFFEYTRMSKYRMKHWIIVCIGCLLIGWQYLQFFQHKIVMEYDYPTFITTAFENIPRIIFKSPDLLLRSTSWISVVVLKDIQLATIYDIFFLIGFPVLQLLSLLVALVAYRRIEANVGHYERGTSPLLKVLALVAGIFFLLLPMLLVVGNPRKTAAEIEERKSIVEEVNKLEQKIGRSVIYLDEDQLLQLVAKSYTEEKQLEKAEDFLKKALTSNPHNYHTAFMLAVIYQTTHRINEAIDMYHKVAEINPAHAVTHKNLGILYLHELQDYPQALHHLRQSIALSPHQEQAKEIEAVIEQLASSLAGKVGTISAQ